MWTTLLSAILVINELMASNAGEVMSPAINFDSWIELYNPAGQSVNLGGLTLCDAKGHSWKMPTNMGSVPAKGFKVVWLGSNDIKSNQATFKLDCDGGTISILDNDSNVVATETYPEALSRTAWARKTDGGDEWGWTATPTPEATNATAVFAASRVAAPQVSVDSKLFTGTLQVNVDIPEGAKLMYTTDGSLPTARSKQSMDGRFTVKATTNYTFRLFQEGFLPSVPVTRSYILTSNKYTFPVVSIVGDKRYFTDPKIGIDCNGDGTNGKTGNGQNSPRNYNQPWDRPVNFSYIGTDGQMLFNQDVNISVSGGWTRSQSERSFKLKSNKVFDGQNRFDFSFFPQKPYIRSKVLLLRNGGNDVWTHNARFIDPALQTVVQRSGIDVDLQSYVPIIEYVNGVCRGVLNLREPNNDKFVYANFGYDDEEIDMFENFVFTNGTDAALKRLFELGNNADDPEAYYEITQLLDIDEFTNWMAVELFLGNEDWPDNNIKGYRSQDDGRYRFVLFDLDYSFGLMTHAQNDNPFTRLNSYTNMKFIKFFLNLLNNEEYRRKFIDTFCIVAGSVFEKERAGKIVDELAANLKPMLSMTNDKHNPDRCVSTIKNQLNTRLSRMMTCMQQFKPMQLTGAKKQTVNLSADTEGAHITVNGIDVPYASFKGTLFSPVALQAKAPAGYAFDSWMRGTSVVSNDAYYELPAVTTTFNLTATFKPLDSEGMANEGIKPVRINEVSAANGIYVNEYFKRNDWVELYNTTSQPIDVEGMYLTDNLKKPKKYQITKGKSQTSTVIPAHGFLIVWCDKLDPVSQLHASFKLAAEGGDVQLMAADESWTDVFSYQEMKSDQTAGRYPDGGSQIFSMNVPTIGRANLTSSYATPIVNFPPTGISDLADTGLSVHYAVGILTVRGAADNVSVRIVNMAGQHVATRTATLSEGYAEVSVGSLATGIYIATVTDAQGHKATCKFAIK